MMEFLFRTGFAFICAIAAVAISAWVLIILPDWLRRRRERKAKEVKR